MILSGGMAQIHILSSIQGIKKLIMLQV